MTKETAGSMPLDTFIAAAVRDIATGLARAGRDVVGGRSEPVVVGFDLAVVVHSGGERPVIAVIGDSTVAAVEAEDTKKKKKKKNKDKKKSDEKAQSAGVARNEIRVETLSRLRFSLPLSLPDTIEKREPEVPLVRRGEPRAKAHEAAAPQPADVQAAQPPEPLRTLEPMRRRNSDPGTFGLA